jgi:lipopolysaccharide biosynthesis glycosyltransferase
MASTMRGTAGGRLSKDSSLSICLATDAGYAFPTAVVAKSVIMTKSPNLGPVYYVWVDQVAPPRELVKYLERCGVVLVVAPTSVLLSLKGDSGHVTQASSARLALAEILEEFPIERFLYLDGDVEITGSLSDLSEVDLPESHIAAAENAETLFSCRYPHKHEEWTNRMRGLGMSEGSGYFNAGVLLAHMKSWKEISSQAKKFYRENAGKCRLYDQCALNAVCHDRRLVLSPRWNVQSAFLGLRHGSRFSPRIIHYNGGNKPWAPVLLGKTWHARKPFFAARSEMPELWMRTAQRGRFRVYKKPLINYLIRAIRRRGAQKIYQQYLATTEFADLPSR